MKKVSIVIPTKNAGPEFETTLININSQKTTNKFEVEIIILDSGSVDMTIELSHKYNAKVMVIEPSSFSHGGTRNYGISVSEGEYVVLLVQDAIPLNDVWLINLINNLDKDPTVAGVYSKQIPRADCNIFTKNSLENWITFKNERVEQFIENSEEYKNLSPIEKQHLVTFDNVSSCIRKSVWEEIQFNIIEFGEDIDWSKRVIESGLKIVYEPNSAVIHSHNRSNWYEFKRTFVCHKILNNMFETRLVPTLKNLILNLGADIKIRTKIVNNSIEVVDNRFNWYIKGILLSVGMQLGMYLGGKYNYIKSNKIKKNLDRILSRGV